MFYSFIILYVCTILNCTWHTMNRLYHQYIVHTAYYTILQHREYFIYTMLYLVIHSIVYTMIYIPSYTVYAILYKTVNIVSVSSYTTWYHLLE